MLSKSVGKYYQWCSCSDKLQILLIFPYVFNYKNLLFSLTLKPLFMPYLKIETHLHVIISLYTMSEQTKYTHWVRHYGDFREGLSLSLLVKLY